MSSCTGLTKPLCSEERISTDGSYPSDSTLNLDEDEKPDFKDLDSEGRAVVVDVGLFVLIYCPNTSTERKKFKRNYQELLEARIDALIKDGREMVVGDLEACGAVQGQEASTSCVAKGLQGEESFWGVDRRKL